MSLGACLVANDPKGIGEAMIKRRIDGVSWKDIADEFSLGSPGAARNYFKKVTGIADFKAKGKALEQLLKEVAEGAPAMGANTATAAVKSVQQAVTQTPTQLADTVGVTNGKWKSVEQLAADNNIDYMSVVDVIGMNQQGKGYTAIQQAVAKEGDTISFAQIDDIIWNDLLAKSNGKVWEAYLNKPTSQTGFEAVKKKVSDLHAKGLSVQDIAKVKEAPPESVIDAIIKDKWTMPPMGSKTPIIPPPPPPPPVVFSGQLSGRNFVARQHEEISQWSIPLDNGTSYEHRNAIDRYTGSGYHDMNGRLRQTGDYAGKNSNTTSIKDLTKAMHPLDKDSIVVRNVHGAERVFGHTDLTETVGKVFQDKGFISTTIKQDGIFSGNVRMVINVPQGHPSRYVGTIGSHKNEREIILQRGTKMVITKVQRLPSSYGEDKWEVFAEVIGVG